MESAYTFSHPLSPEIIEAVSNRTRIPKAFIEKDWYAVQLLKILSEYKDNSDIKLAFAGGTSLSKGFGIINRFSEDLDFILYPMATGKPVRSSFRKSIISHIESYGKFKIANLEIHSKLFQANIEYDGVFETDALRPHLKLEMTFSNLKLPTSQQDIHSFVAEAYKNSPEARLACVSPIETAANKMSALAWRMFKNESPEKDEINISRHLHDLAALKNKIFENKETFIDSVRKTLEDDIENRAKELQGMSYGDIFQKGLTLLSDNQTYSQEY